MSTQRKAAKIKLFSHHFVITHFEPRIRQMIIDFSSDLVQWHSFYRPRVGNVRVPKRVFASSKLDRSEYRLHIHKYADFIKYLASKGIHDNLLDIERVPMHEPVPIDIYPVEQFTDRDYQVPIIDFGVQPGHTKVLPLYAGGGKTYVALKIMSILGYRFSVEVAAKFQDKWGGDVEEVLGLEKHEYLSIKGGKSLVKALKKGLQGKLNVKCVIVSINTLKRYYQAYESGDLGNYPVPPYRMHEVLGIGSRIVDEAHLELHAVFKGDTYTNVPKTIFLSATLTSRDPFINRVRQVIYPPEMRIEGQNVDKRMNVKNVFYQIPNADKLKYKRSQGYSHIMLEDEILARKGMTERYIGMIKSVMEEEFLSVYKPGMKLIIFAASIPMCTVIAERLQELCPDLTVYRYVGEDDYDRLHTSDVIVTTPGSGGTGFDIKGLRTAIATIAVNSLETNEQMAGRLRKMIGEFEGIIPTYVYLSCSNIAKHVEYHQGKYEALRNLAITHTTHSSNYVV